MNKISKIIPELYLNQKRIPYLTFVAKRLGQKL